MAKPVVHYVIALTGDGWGFADIDLICGLYIYTKSHPSILFTNHKPDVTCLNCLKALRKEGK